MDNRSWTLRYTPDRQELIERLRSKLKESGQEIETIHGVVTNASVFDAALKALEERLDQELSDKKK